MLDPVITFFSRIFYLIGRGIGYAVGIILGPCLWAGRWYTQRPAHRNGHRMIPTA